MEENFSENSLRQCRKWFQAAVDSGKKWRQEAKEDFEFTAGKQWTDEELKIFQSTGRPAITINRILPLINILSGYQRLNRYDLDFLARTSDDVELCQVRRGITKYIMDRCDYDAVESQVFLDCAIGGLGWFGVRYKFDDEIQDGEAVIERIDPFGIYVDPEAHELDFSDAKFLIRAKWVAKDELKQVYPEQAEAIENNFAVYDSAEEDGETRPDIDPLYYSSELQKVRVVVSTTNANLAQQMFINTREVLDNNYNIVNQSYQNTMNNNSTNAGLSQNKFANSRNVIDANTALTQNQFNNSMAVNSANAGLEGNKYSASVEKNNALVNNARQIMENTQNTNGLNSNLTQQAYTNDVNRYNTAINIAQQLLNNADKNAQTTSNLYNLMQGYENNGLNSLNNLYQQQFANAINTANANAAMQSNALNSLGTPIAVAGAASEAYMNPALTLWNASMGMAGVNNSALASVSGKGSTSSTTSQSGGFLSGLLGCIF